MKITEHNHEETSNFNKKDVHIGMLSSITIELPQVGCPNYPPP